jgi:hypothetical protein
MGRDQSGRDRPARRDRQNWENATARPVSCAAAGRARTIGIGASWSLMGRTTSRRPSRDPLAGPGCARPAAVEPLAGREAPLHGGHVPVEVRAGHPVRRLRRGQRPRTRFGVQSRRVRRADGEAPCPSHHHRLSVTGDHALEQLRAATGPHDVHSDLQLAHRDRTGNLDCHPCHPETGSRLTSLDGATEQRHRDGEPPERVKRTAGRVGGRQLLDPGGSRAEAGAAGHAGNQASGEASRRPCRRRSAGRSRRSR